MRYAISRRKRNVIFALCLFAGAALVALDRSWPGGLRHLSPAATTSSVAADDVTRYDAKTFTVVRVVDGDTLDIDVPDGNHAHTRIRLWGVDTPETKDPRRPAMYFGSEASQFTTKLTLGKNVVIFLDRDRNTRDRYNRLLAYVQLPDKRFLNEVLLSEGYAYADTRFKHGFYNKYRQLESAARSQKKGLWGNVRPDQFPEWFQRRRQLAAKNPSSDAQEGDINDISDSN